MSMQINGNYGCSKTGYAEQVKEKQAAGQVEKEGAKGEAEEKKVSEPRDEYISSEKSGKRPAGLYRVEQDGNGRRKIFFDDPNKAGRVDGKEELKGKKDAAGKPEEICVGNTDRVDREIRKLKEKERQLMQQIRSAEDEERAGELEKKLAQVESELSRKDNDAYRRQNASFSER